MELQIQDLVASIKNEGIENAKKEAARIIEEAQKKADSIISEARAEADTIFENSKKEIEILRQSAIVSAQQAKRDAIIGFKQEIEAQFNKILTRESGKAMNGENLAKLIQCAVSGEDLTKVSVEIKEVTSALENILADEIEKGLEIKPSKTIKSGFRVVMKDGSGFVDCTEEEIARILSPFFGHIGL